MGLKVIGAGFGRTGTDSLRTALNILGFGPCHHMHEVISDPTQKQIWRAIANGARPDWDAAFAGFNASVDWPSAYYWRALADHYPDAKVILTWRPAEDWLASMKRTIFNHMGPDSDPESLGVRLIRDQVFGGDLSDENVLSVYLANIEAVKSTVEPDRLLLFSPGDGWGPLCRFLGVDIPDEPYPNRNSAAEFTERN